MIETLNAWFDCIAAAVEAHGGEILKFMGDGLLAIFRADEIPRMPAAALSRRRGDARAGDRG